MEMVQESLRSHPLDTGSLQVLLESIEGFKANGDIGSLKEAAKLCADVSRVEDNRIPLAEAEIVRFFHDYLSKNIQNTELTFHALRLLGNTCADRDANRQRIIDHPSSLKPVIKAISISELQNVAAVVLYNICTDYEPAQIQAIKNGACEAIINTLVKDEVDYSNFDYPLRILEMLLSHDSGKEACPENALLSFFRLASSPMCPFDERLSFISCITSLLSTSRFQNITISQDVVPAMLIMLEKTYGFVPDETSDKKDASLASFARSTLVASIGEVSAQISFLKAYPLESDLITRVRKWLEIEEDGKVDLIVAACLILGNVGRSDEICTKLVQKFRLQDELYKIIRKTIKRYNDTREEFKRTRGGLDKGDGKDGKEAEGAVAVGVLHAAAGVLKNLAIPQGNKEILGEEILAVVEEIVAMEGVGVGQVWYSAVGMGRLVCADCLVNVKRLLGVNSEDPSKNNDTRPILSSLLRVYPKADEVPIKTEIARTIARAIRTINTETISSAEKSSLKRALFSHESIARPLWDLVLQDKWPAVHLEGWLSLALAANSPEGATIILQTCGEEEWKLVETMALSKGEHKKREKDNAMVLLAGLKQNGKERGDEIEALLVKAVQEVD
ncbi:hypothetical protein RUND412_007535 [Rhizina undulata]